MARDLTQATEGEKAISNALIGLAATVLAAVIALWPVLLPALNEAGDVLAIVLFMVSCGLLMASIIFGGRGQSNGPRRIGWKGNFNLQALSGLLGVLILIGNSGVAIFLAEDTNGQDLKSVTEAIESGTSTIAGKLDQLNAQAAQGAKAQMAIEAAMMRLKDEMAAVSRQNADLASRLGVLESQINRK